MEDKVIWDLSDGDLNEIQDLYEKKLALESLVKIIDAKDEELYQRLIKDYGKTMREFQTWWEVKSKTYHWEGVHWWVDFGNKQVCSRDERR